MEAKLHAHQDAGLHSEHGEKKSVLKKVKEKAKKIMDTIKKHGHNHQHQVEDEDPQVHGAPMHESTVVKSRNLQRGSNTNLDKGEQHVRVEGDSKALATGNRVPQSEMPPAMETNQNTLPINRKFELEENPHAPSNTPAKIPSSNYDGKQAKVDQFVNPVAESADSTDEYSHDTIAEKISSATYAVAEKAISAKNLVASKLGYSCGDQDSTSKVQVSSEGGDNGGGDSCSSMKGYMCEKFRPGDEDKALSEAITDAFQQKKEAVWGAGAEEEEQQQQRGKVTMSKEVAERLGTGAENKREGEDAMAAGEESSGQGVRERLKDAVGAWLEKSTGLQTAQDSVGNAFVNNAAGSGGGGGGGGVGPMSSR